MTENPITKIHCCDTFSKWDNNGNENWETFIEGVNNPKHLSPNIKKKHKKQQQQHHHQINKQENALTLHYSNLTISGWLTLTLCDWEMSAGDHLVDDDDANATKLIKTSKVVHGSDKKKCFYLFILSIFYYLFQFRARA